MSALDDSFPNVALTIIYFLSSSRSWTDAAVSLALTALLTLLNFVT